ncbi:expressed unknown protein [Seminavis robusta]|uniref:Methyltransferase domain-containing protein n=1 Tax=Seminavis robusta TaxID=568900 RepID=A0A9N8H195_9STRA|nr:expressed unknown protein [Seminavis robusta]|eukprot:Sro13_g009940.1 n/a (554) ;mRNA; r:67913-69574
MLACLPEEDNDNDEINENVLEEVAGAESAEVKDDNNQEAVTVKTTVDDTNVNTDSITGILVGRCVRGFYTTMNVVVVGDDPLVDSNNIDEEEDDHYHVLVRIQFHHTCSAHVVKELRSYLRRYCKNGDLVHIQRGIYRDAATSTNQLLDHTTRETKNSTTAPTTNNSQTEEAETAFNWRDPRFVVTVHSIPDAQNVIRLIKPTFWGISKCQAWQQKLYHQKQTEVKKKPPNTTQQQQQQQQNGCMAHHAGGLEKRKQGEFVANFLLHMVMASLATNNDDDDNADEHENHDLGNPSTWANSIPTTDQATGLLKQRALEYLNGGSGVLDVAGGSGHVSMALGMLGIQSTVVDPREAVGKLPSRDRKLWKRALGERGQAAKQRPSSPSNNTPYPIINPGGDPIYYCQPIKPFQSLRAWFGTPPPGVDSNRRNTDNATVPVCDNTHDAVRNCRAIVALHPDEATDAIVDVAVQQRIPLVIVPCCVYCRLFPHRRLPTRKIQDESTATTSNQLERAMVSTYQDLLVYLQAKDPAIQKATLPFMGANTVLFRPLESKST